jgi:hypothetical protein
MAAAAEKGGLPPMPPIEDLDLRDANGRITELGALRSALARATALIREATSRDRVPWTAIATFVRHESDLARRIAALEATEAEIADISADEVRAGILALPDHMLAVVEDALEARREAGIPVVEAGA